MDWFKHDTTSMDDPDILEAEELFGDAGYSIFFKILEIYGKEFSHLIDGKLKISFTVMRRKLNKSGVKIERILSFYAEKKRILFTFEDGYVYIEIPKFTDKLSNWTARQYSKKEDKPTEAPTEAPLKYLQIEKEEEEDKRIYIRAFESFWHDYPIKKGKAKAFDAWKRKAKQKRLPSVENIFHALKEQTQEKEGLINNKQFCPEWKHPTTWINQECWNDEPVKINPNNNQKSFGTCPNCKRPNIDLLDGGLCRDCTRGKHKI